MVYTRSDFGYFNTGRLGQFIIGLFIGIDLFICGWVYVMAAFSARTSPREPLANG